MRILVDISHPAQFHFFKHFIWNMQGKGHKVLVTAKEKDLTLTLMRASGFPWENVGSYGVGRLAKMRDIFRINLRLFRAARRFRPDIILGFGSVNAAQVSTLLRKPCILFDDDEMAWKLYILFASTTCTFSGFRANLGAKQVKVNGYKELAYLHPAYFQPDPSVLEALQVKPGERFVIMRFVTQTSFHYTSKSGLDFEARRWMAGEMAKENRLFITSEVPLPSELEAYRMNLPPEKVHQVMHYARMLIGDSRTMTTEAAVLGTPAVRCDRLAGPKDLGNFIELEKKYDLIYSFREPAQALEKARQLLERPHLKEEWAEKRHRLLADKINVTDFMVDFVENYPQSFLKYKGGKG